MARTRLFNVRVDETEAASFEASCVRLGISRSDALRAFVSAMSGGELSVISTDDGLRVVPGPYFWVSKEKP